MAPSVLFVDDDRNLCQIVAKALRGEGYEVQTAFDGESALSHIQDDPPDLLFLDVLMPRKDGFQVLERIRALAPPMNHLPTVLLASCTPTPAYVQRAKALAAVELIAKPVPLDRMLELVVAHLGEVKAPARKKQETGRVQLPSRTAISGHLDRIPFPAVLHHLHGLRATGVLHLETEKKRKWIQHRDGYPVAVRSNLVRETLGHFLERTGRITRQVLEASRREMEVHSRRQGEVLVAMRVLSEEKLAEALRDQADEKLFEVFGWEDGRFHFERDARLEKANVLGVGRSPASLILEGVRSRFAIARVDRYLKAQSQRIVAHGSSPFYRFQDLHVDSEEESLLRGLDGRQTLGAFLSESESIRRTVYGLLAAGLLELRGGAPEPMTTMRAEARPARPAGAVAGPVTGPAGKARSEEQHKELTALAERLRSNSFFDLLGVKEDVAVPALRRAYEELSARVHPDRFSGASRTVKELAEQLFARVNEAYETLSDPRRKLQHQLDRKKTDREAVRTKQAEKALQAATAFRDGETALRQRDYESAMRFFGKALELYPDEGDHHAHYGYALHLCHPSDPGMIGEAMEHVRRGLKLASHRDKAFLYMGCLHKALGQLDVAEKMFTRAVQIQPECVEALRELRLINMRREKSKGLIGRLLKR